jgi:hypothetical protein
MSASAEWYGSPAPVSADAIARMADEGKAISRFFEGRQAAIKTLVRHYLAQRAIIPELARS